MRLCDYFDQEDKVSRGVKEQSQSQATVFFAAGFGIHSAMYGLQIKGKHAVLQKRQIF